MPSGFSGAGRLVCTRPFEWLEVHPGGAAFLCCPSWLKTSVGNVLTEPLADIWNGPQALAIRKAVLNGSFHYCKKKRCPKLRSRIPPVLAPEAVRDENTREAVREGKAVLDHGPKSLNLCFDPSCNLACPSCRTAPLRVAGEERDRVVRVGRVLLEGAGRGVENLSLSGTGDPFGSPFFRTLLQDFRPADFPSLKSVHLHTNGQLWNESMWATMPAIHPFVRTAEISVDAATAETYASNRGTDFRRLVQNLEFIGSLPVKVKLSMVVQENNFREMPAFVGLGRRLGFSVYFSRLVNWGTFNREEFRKKAVHLPEHPEHSLFLDILGEVARMPEADLGNLPPDCAE
ncbi:MAG: SPASM domain-containing protein [Desulfuromonadales bacterium]|jgi:MoaA/NifB/PqqE/SkfB family radical SAM enzyme